MRVAPDRKTEISPVDGTPDKRMFWSIIADYDLNTGICELVDNAIDLWLIASKRNSLRVDVLLDFGRQLIGVVDNAGGVDREHLRLLVAPGGSQNDPKSPVIGIFGVGSKRAGIALGERVEIRTRRGRGDTFGIDVTPEWLETPTWEISAYSLPDIRPNTTEVQISRLRKVLSPSDVERLRRHLGSVYGRFIQAGCDITLNREPVRPVDFESWSFPPSYPPRITSFAVDFGEDGSVDVKLLAGLIGDRDSEAENYGVYVYCNDRLIVKELRTRDVGYYVTTEAGVPHPDASLCRVIVDLSGPARLMPWTSNKSGINPDHEVFRELRGTLIQLVSYYTKLSRRLKDDWDRQVFRFAEGDLELIDQADISASGKIVLPPLPKGNRSHTEQLKSWNSRAVKRQPWALGLVESVAAVDALFRQKLETKNRIALVLLDSNLEIALKEFIVHRPDLFSPRIYDDSKIKTMFSRRHNVITEVVAKEPKIKPFLPLINHYYGQRNKLIHERATVGITDNDIHSYRDVVASVLKILFGLRF